MPELFRVPVQRQQILLAAGDLAILVLSFLLAFFVARFAEFNIFFVLDRYTGGSLIYFTVYMLVFYVGQLYEFDERYRETRSFLHICLLVGAAFVIIATLYYVIPFWRIARKVMAMQAPMVAVGIYLWRSGYELVSRRLVAPRRVLLVGAGENTESLVEELRAGYAQEYQVVGLIDDEPARASTRVLGVPVLGDGSQIAQIAAREHVEIIVFASGFRSALDGQLVRHVLELKTRGVKVYELPTFYMKVTTKVPVRYIEDRWLLFGQEAPGLAAEETRRVRRLLDIFVSFACLTLSSPLILIVAALIKLTSRGPVFYRQERVGLYGRPYPLVKFRTMTVDAEADGPRWAAPGDNRVTALGRILRRLRLDEIPQFWNVLKGEMSLIGPRPERPHFVELLEKKIPYYELRSAVRPGMTGWAQVNFPYGNSEEDAHAKLQYDLYYIQEKSLLLDAVIVLKTLQTLLYRPGI
jgi:exopolysaccharide biosynthesis polyprenyl glycosylphosphotransferase